MKVIDKLVIFLLALSINTTASAVSYDWFSGELLGINGLDVNGMLYDVDFVDGSAQSIFYNETTASNDFDFGYPNTLAPTQALLSALPEEVLIDPWKLNGIEGPFFDSLTQQYFSSATIYTTGTYPLPAPYNPELIQGSSLSLYSIDGSNVFQTNVSPNHLIGYTSDLTNFLSIVYADWSPASPVPIPATIWLFGAGLIGLFGFMKGKHKKQC